MLVDGLFPGVGAMAVVEVRTVTSLFRTSLSIKPPEQFMH